MTRADDILAASTGELADVRAELEQARRSAERWEGSAGYYSDLVRMARESEDVMRSDRGRLAQALAEIRHICTSMMDGWGQTVDVLERINKIAASAIGPEPRQPDTFA